MSIWCVFIVPQLTTRHSNIVVRLTKMTVKRYACTLHIAHLNQLNEDEIIALKCAIRSSYGNSSIPKYFEYSLNIVTKKKPQWCFYCGCYIYIWINEVVSFLALVLIQGNVHVWNGNKFAKKEEIMAYEHTSHLSYIKTRPTTCL